MKRLTQLRLERGWSKSELARRAGLNQTTVSAIENGRLVPYEVQLAKLSAALDVVPESLCEEVTTHG